MRPPRCRVAAAEGLGPRRQCRAGTVRHLWRPGRSRCPAAAGRAPVAAIAVVVVRPPPSIALRAAAVSLPAASGRASEASGAGLLFSEVGIRGSRRRALFPQFQQLGRRLQFQPCLLPPAVGTPSVPFPVTVNLPFRAVQQLMLFCDRQPTRCR